ncbi:Tetratricopeptide-like helical [Artemisia annua]|uniref:Tetratricopeptide-like helical n=1 Tax=Artemisia annua TaxID=35608 RepID=A0A2U1PZY3_ARTAN|nr:Tetratricopeptide-like helical [Artemisia annua]
MSFFWFCVTGTHKFLWILIICFVMLQDQNHSLQFHSSFIKRLSLERELEAHQGCVNTIAWNSKGSLLISGSDDTHINLWSYESRKLLHSIDSGHTANIFCTKFVPETSDELVVSGAADAEVRLFNLSRLKKRGVVDSAINPSARFQCHSRRIKKLAVEPGNPSVVWSASEDGTLRQHDLRETTSCSPADTSHRDCRNVLLTHLSSVGTADRQLKVAQLGSHEAYSSNVQFELFWRNTLCQPNQFSKTSSTEVKTYFSWIVSVNMYLRFPLVTPHSVNYYLKFTSIEDYKLDLRCGAKKSLADPPRQSLVLKSCDINMTRPHLLLVGGSDAFARLYDRRMLAPLSASRQKLQPPPCVNYYCPTHLSDRGHQGLHLTHVTFSPNGEEILLNNSGEHVYLMDLYMLQMYVLLPIRMRVPCVSKTEHFVSQLQMMWDSVLKWCVQRGDEMGPDIGAFGGLKWGWSWCIRGLKWVTFCDDMGMKFTCFGAKIGAKRGQSRGCNGCEIA